MTQRFCTAIGVALVLAASGVTAPAALATEIQHKAPGLKGIHVQQMSGLVNGQPGKVQYRLQVASLHQKAAAGTQQWRSCEGVETACKQGSAEGDGWSKPENVLMVRTPAGNWAGSSANGTLALRITKAGRFDASYLGKAGLAKQTRDTRSTTTTLAVSSDDEDCSSTSGIYTCYGFEPGS